MSQIYIMFKGANSDAYGRYKVDMSLFISIINLVFMSYLPALALISGIWTCFEYGYSSTGMTVTTSSSAPVPPLPGP